MASATLRRELTRLQRLVAMRVAATSTSPALHRLRQDAARLMADAGLEPDPWQARLLRRPCSRTLLLSSRSAGKSTAAAGLALRSALLEPPSLVLLTSPTQRQSSELMRKVLELYRGLGRPVPSLAEAATHLELANGSRVVSLPGTEGTIRTYNGVRLLVLDEAARIPDALYKAVRPMVAVSHGAIFCLSTPWGKSGWFYEEWAGRERWDRVQVTAHQCPRIPPEFLEEEMRALGPEWFGREYLCEFGMAAGALFTEAQILAAYDNDVRPLWG